MYFSFSVRKGNGNHKLGMGCFVHQHLLAVGCHVVLRGHWCDALLNLHAPVEDKSSD